MPSRLYICISDAFVFDGDSFFLGTRILIWDSVN